MTGKILFGHPDSGHALKVRFFMLVAGIVHEYEEVDIWAPREQRSARFRQYARFHEVPTLIDDGMGYVQSNAILMHLARQSGKWGAQNPALFERTVQWLFWEANKIGLCLPQLIASHQYEGSRLNDGAYQWLAARYAHDVGVLDAELADGRRWMLGDELTIADFSLAGYLLRADEAQAAVPEHVTNWLNRLRAHPQWQPPAVLLKGSAGSIG